MPLKTLVFFFSWGIFFLLSAPVLAQTNCGDEYCNPLRFRDVQTFLVATLTYLQGFLVVLAIIFIIIGALIYITSAGDEKRVTWAKGAILAAVIGLAIAIAAPLFLREIGSILGWTSPSTDLDLYGTKLTLSQVLMKILSFLLGILGVVSVIALVLGGFLYITSAGEADRADTGKKIVTFALIGLALSLSALVIIRQVASFFAGT